MNSSYLIKKLKNRRAAGAGGGPDPWIYYPDVANGKFERRRVSDTAGTGIEEVYAHADITTYGVRPFALDVANGWLAWTNDIGSGNGNRSNYYDIDGDLAYINNGGYSWVSDVIEDPTNSRWLSTDQDSVKENAYANPPSASPATYLSRSNGYWASSITIYEAGATPKILVSTAAFDTNTGIRRTWDGKPEGENGDVFTATQSKNPVHVVADPNVPIAFFSDHTDVKIYSIDPSGDLGQALTEVVSTLVGNPQNLDVDTSAQKLYYCDPTAAELRRCDYDGSNDELVWAHSDRFRVYSA